MIALLALAGLLQEASPEETLKKIEASLEKAKTVAVTFKVDGLGAKEGADRELKARGTALLKEGGKYRYTIVMLRAGQEQETTLVCDGAKAAMKRGESTARVVELPKGERVSMSAKIARMGAMMSGSMPPGEGNEDPARSLALKDFKAGENDGESKTIHYSAEITVRGRTASFDTRLWYDPKTLRLHKRTVTIRQGGEAQGSLTETYEKFELDGDLPDEKFKVEEK